MPSKHFSVSIDGKVAIVKLERSTLTAEVTNELIETYQTLDKDVNVQVIVTTGQDKYFCTGAELSAGWERVKAGDEIYRDFGGVLALCIHNLSKVTIAAINGAAAGIGMTCTLPMDLRVTHKANKIVFPFAQRGIIAESCSSYFLPRLIPFSHAMALVTTGRTLPASHPWLAPLWAELVDTKEEVLPTALSLARDIAAKCSPVSNAIQKRLLWNVKSPEEAQLLGSLAGIIVAERDGAEGAKSFLEKRPPNFQDKITDPKIAGLLEHLQAKL